MLKYVRIEFQHGGVVAGELMKDKIWLECQNCHRQVFCWRYEYCRKEDAHQLGKEECECGALYYNIDGAALVFEEKVTRAESVLQ